MAAFLVALALQWNSIQSLAMADGIAYITGGVNLVTEGAFISAFGEWEIWFPPLYPLLIGLASWGGHFDPVVCARLISAAFGVWGLILVWRAARLGVPNRSWSGLLAAIVLAANASYQLYSVAVMSHAAATALSLAAFVVWLRAGERARFVSSAGIGLLIGLGYLVRPEVILLVGLWPLVDIATIGMRPTVARWLVAAATLAVIVAPYIVYLHEHTGRWQISGKGEVTVAIGRSQYYGGYRDRINPETLTWEYAKHDVTWQSELRRYVFNVGQIIAGYRSTLRGWLGGGTLLASGLGAFVLLRERRYRFFAGLLAQCGFLTALAATWCDARMLHPTWPVIAILAGVGLQSAGSTLLSGGWLWLRAIAFGLLAWAAFGLAESATRWPRWTVAEGVGAATILRDAGLALKARVGEKRGVVYEFSATAGYYGGQFRRLLPAANDLETVIRYAQRRERPDREVWLALWTEQAKYLHSELASAFLERKVPLPIELELEDDRGRVTIYRIPKAESAWDGAAANGLQQSPR